MTRRAVGFLLPVALLAGLTPLPAQAQWPPEKFTNLKVLPDTIQRDTLIRMMASFTRALGVRCTYCHVGEEGKPLDTYDFPSDDKRPKRTAREMLRMVSHINGTHLAEVAERREPPVTVECATCHRGVAVPRQLADLLVLTWAEHGVDSAIATYTALRQRYYGRAAYDFGEVPLTDAAGTVERRGAQADAVRLHELNIAQNPRSAFALTRLGEMWARAGDSGKAVAAYERALAIDTTNTGVARRLGELRGR